MGFGTSSSGQSGLDDKYIEEVFGAGGYLSQKFPGYVPRTGQIQLARAVHDVIASGTHLIAEGPTGTGKSLAYAVPATYIATKSARKCLIVTANIALQEQLVTKDLPLLQSILPWPFKFSLLKGRSNYLCKKSLGVIHSLKDPNLYRGMPGEREFERLLRWSQTTKEGDKSELDFEPDSEMWGRVSVGPDECLGQQCKSYVDCYGVEQRRKAQTVDLVVTNYHMLYTHLLIKEVTYMDKILPAFDLCILDEGHKAADIARDFVGFKFGRGMVRRAARFLEQLKELATERILSEATDDFFKDLEFYGRSRDYKTRLRVKNPIRSEKLLKAMDKAISSYQQALDLNRYGAIEPVELVKAINRLTELQFQVAEAMELKDSENTAYFIEIDDKKVALCSKPVRVDEWMKDMLFDETDSVVLTSATISTGGSFSYMADDVGVNISSAGHYEVEVPSPFNWESNALLVVPGDMPDPVKDRENYNKAVIQQLGVVLEQAQGKTLALFTSWNMLNRAHEALRYGRHRILKQGEAPRTKLVEEFKLDVSSSLFGTSSFWEGIDVPGEALSVVVVDKLPFPTPDDPVLDMLSEHDDETFFNYSVPRAVIAWKQGVGRLLRTITDRGVVVCLDPRIMTKWDSYGKKFYNCLPRMQLSRDLRHISTFLKGDSR